MSTVLSVFSLIGRLVLIVVLVGSGYNAALSLTRWEWSRASLSGLVFVASLSILLTLLVLGRISALERRIHASGSAGLPGFAAPTASRTQPEESFPWLPRADRTYVFMPVLLGFGLIVSVLAAVVERLAGFVIGRNGQPASPDQGSYSDLMRSPVRVLISVAVIAIAATVTLIFIARATMAPVIEAATPGERTYHVTIEARYGAEDDPVTNAQTLALFCSTHIHGGLTLSRPVTRIDGNTAEVVVSPVLGLHRERAFSGCLTDFTLDRRLASVDWVDPAPIDDDGEPIATPPRPLAVGP